MTHRVYPRGQERPDVRHLRPLHRLPLRPNLLEVHQGVHDPRRGDGCPAQLAGLRVVGEGDLTSLWTWLAVTLLVAFMVVVALVVEDVWRHRGD